MFRLRRIVLLLIGLIILLVCESAQMQKKQSGETQFTATNESRDLFVVMIKKKYGFIDKTGKIVIAPQFDYGSEFAENRALVAAYSPDFKLNFIDETGKIVESLNFDHARNFSEGLAAVGVGEFTTHGGGDHKFGFIDQTGKLVIEINFREALDFSGGLAAVKNDEGKWGYIDRNGKLVIAFQFEAAFSFSEDLACVLTNGLFGFIDKSGKIVIAPQFGTPSQFRENLAVVEIPEKGFKPWTYYGRYASSGGKPVVIDRAGNEAFKVAGNVVKIGDFSEGLARIEVKRRENDFYTGFIDRTGKEIIKLPFYSSSGSFSEGVSLIERDGKFGFIDKTGRIIVKPQYSYAEDFQNGLARIEIGKRIGDKETKLGYVPKSGYINKTGKVIWQPTN